MDAIIFALGVFAIPISILSTIVEIAKFQISKKTFITNKNIKSKLNELLNQKKAELSKLSLETTLNPIDEKIHSLNAELSKTKLQNYFEILKSYYELRQKYLRYYQKGRLDKILTSNQIPLEEVTMIRKLIKEDTNGEDINN